MSLVLGRRARTSSVPTAVESQPWHGARHAESRCRRAPVLSRTCRVAPIEVDADELIVVEPLSIPAAADVPPMTVGPYPM